MSGEVESKFETGRSAICDQLSSADQILSELSSADELLVMEVNELRVILEKLAKVDGVKKSINKIHTEEESLRTLPDLFSHDVGTMILDLRSNLNTLITAKTGGFPLQEISEATKSSCNFLSTNFDASITFIRWIIQCNISVIDPNKRPLSLSEKVNIANLVRESLAHIVSKKKFEIQEWVEVNLWDLPELRNPNKNILILDIPHDFAVHCDASTVGPVLANLFKNPISLMEPARVGMLILIQAGRIEGDCVSIRVLNLGTELSYASLSRSLVQTGDPKSSLVKRLRDATASSHVSHQEVYDELLRLGVTTRDTGTGTGLFLANKVADLHGGSFRISEHPTGAVIAELVLPDLEASGDSEILSVKQTFTRYALRCLAGKEVWHPEVFNEQNFPMVSSLIKAHLKRSHPSGETDDVVRHLYRYEDRRANLCDRGDQIQFGRDGSSCLEGKIEGFLRRIVDEIKQQVDGNQTVAYMPIRDLDLIGVDQNSLCNEIRKALELQEHTLAEKVKAGKGLTFDFGAFSSDVRQLPLKW